MTTPAETQLAKRGRRSTAAESERKRRKREEDREAEMRKKEAFHHVGRLLQTINPATNQVYSKQAACDTAGIAKTTYNKWVRLFEETGALPNAGGRIFDVEEEDWIFMVIMECHKRGYSATEDELEEYILRQAASKPRTRNFKDNVISPDWWLGFYDRYPEVKVKRSRGIESERMDNISPEVIDPFFDMLAELKQEHPELWEQPCRFWNVDESSLKTSPTRQKVLGPASARHFIRPTGFASETCHTTLLATVSADGDSLPLDFVRSFSAVSRESDLPFLSQMGTDVHITQTETGYSNRHIFLDWFKKRFVPQASEVVRKKLKLSPEDTGFIALFLDGASSHISVELIDYALAHNIILILLPSHTSTHLQPLDKELFGKFKRIYAETLDGFFTHSPTGSFLTQTRQMFMAWTTWTESITADNIRSSWRATGLVPLDRDRVLSWCVERTVASNDLMDDLSAITQLCLALTKGNEVYTMNEIFLIAIKRGPVFRLLYDQAQRSLEENCPMCHRKTKKERPLAIVHKGCRLTAEDMRKQVKEASDLRKRRAEEKNKKVEEKEKKNRHRQQAKEKPFDTNWNPDYLTAAQLQEVLTARFIRFKKGQKKEAFAELVLKSNRAIILGQGQPPFVSGCVHHSEDIPSPLPPPVHTSPFPVLPQRQQSQEDPSPGRRSIQPTTETEANLSFPAPHYTQSRNTTTAVNLSLNPSTPDNHPDAPVHNSVGPQAILHTLLPPNPEEIPSTNINIHHS